MRKLTALILVVVMVFGLCGCKNNDQDSSKKSCTVPEMLIAQAVNMAQQVSLRADGDYLNAISASAQVISMATPFRKAAGTEASAARSFTVNAKNLQAKVQQFSNEVGGSTQLACSSMLSVSTVISLPKTLQEATAVYLRYSSCHFIVSFEPLKDNLVAVWAYPLLPNVGRKVIATFGTDAEEWGASQIQECCKAAADVNFSAKHTERTADASHYTSLSKVAFAHVEKLSAKQISTFTKQAAVIQQTVAASEALAAGIRSAQVYAHSKQTQEQVASTLAQAIDPKLEAYTTQQIYLSVPTQMATTFGENWVATNSILATMLKTGNLGMTAKAGEAPVLMLLELTGEFTIVMSIYPTAYNTYVYSFACLPLTYSDAQEMIESMGAEAL